MDEFKIGREIGMIIRRHHMRANELLQISGMSKTQGEMLMQLKFHGEMSQVSMAEHMQVTPVTVHGVIKRMEKDGWIIRRADENDARVTLVKLTERGDEATGTVLAALRQADREALNGFTQGELELLEQLLSKVKDNLDGCGKVDSIK